MNKEAMNEYYKQMINSKKDSSRKVGWRDNAAQVKRFKQLYKLIEECDSFDVADLGCGLADFYNFLNLNKINFKYTGYDISEAMVQNVTNNANVLLINETEDISTHEYIVLSGIFNMKKKVDNKEWCNYITGQLDVINKKSKIILTYKIYLYN